MSRHRRHAEDPVPATDIVGELVAGMRSAIALELGKPGETGAPHADEVADVNAAAVAVLLRAQRIEATFAERGRLEIEGERERRRGQPRDAASRERGSIPREIAKHVLARWPATHGKQTAAEVVRVLADLHADRAFWSGLTHRGEVIEILGAKVDEGARGRQCGRLRVRVGRAAPCDVTIDAVRKAAGRLLPRRNPRT